MKGRMAKIVLNSVFPDVTPTANCVSWKDFLDPMLHAFYGFGRKNFLRTASPDWQSTLDDVRCLYLRIM